MQNLFELSMDKYKKDNLQFIVIILGLAALGVGATLDIIFMMFGTK
jgi:hypothetical protein